jgi:hypothetical protein
MCLHRGWNRKRRGVERSGLMKPKNIARSSALVVELGLGSKQSYHVWNTIRAGATNGIVVSQNIFEY